MEKPLPLLHRSLAFIVPAEHIRFVCCGQCSTRLKRVTNISLWLSFSFCHEPKFKRWTVLDSKSNDDDRGQRPKQGGVVGAAF